MSIKAKELASPVTGYVVVLQYSDGTGLLGGFGPYATEADAFAAINLLKQMPLAEGRFEVVFLYGNVVAPKPGPVYRGGSDG